MKKLGILLRASLPFMIRGQNKKYDKSIAINSRNFRRLICVVAIVIITIFNLSLWRTLALIVNMEISTNQIEIPQEKDDVNMVKEKLTAAIQDEVVILTGNPLDDKSVSTSTDGTLENSTDSRNLIDQIEVPDNTIDTDDPKQIKKSRKKYDLGMVIDTEKLAIQDEVSTLTDPPLHDNSISSSTEDTLDNSTDSRNSMDQIEIPDGTISANSKIDEKILNAENAIELVHGLLCTQHDNEKLVEWMYLCSGDFVRKATQILLHGDDLDVVQIGAHTGFEMNDPISMGLSRLLENVSAISSSSSSSRVETVRNKFHWTFVEPSPPNFKRLEQNIQSNSICDMRAINVAVVPDGSDAENSANMTFYTVRDTIDPETGYDSLTGEKFPYWITQVSSFSKEPILFNSYVFESHGLDVNDYIVETNVKTMTYSGLMKEALGVENEDEAKPPFLVLIDTEGFDCDIVKEISPLSQFLPEFLVFEHKCVKEPAVNHLIAMGYTLHFAAENAVAIRKAGLLSED